MRRHAVILTAALACFVSIDRAEAKLDILVDKATQRMLVIQDGYIRYMWPVSTGRDDTATPNGVYAPQRLERNWFSTAYYNSPMPYSIFFHNGYAIHGSYAIDQLGGPASHGCVRLHPHHAAVLFDLVQQQGPNNTSIEIADEGRPEQAPLAEREIVAGAGEKAPEPRRVYYYRETADSPVPPAAVPLVAPMVAPLALVDNRPVAWNGLPPRPVPAGRPMRAEVRPAATMPRPPGAAREADPANAAVRLPNGSADPRARSRVFEGPGIAVGSFAARAQPALSISSFKLLPASCWSGGAARWRWWAPGGGAACK